MWDDVSMSVVFHLKLLCQIWRITQPMFDFAKKEVIEFIPFPAFIMFHVKLATFKIIKK